MFVNNYYYFCIKGNVAISGVRETESFGVLFFINGVLKNSTLLELLLSLHEIWRRKLRLWGSKSPACYWYLGEWQSGGGISNPPGEMKEQKLGFAVCIQLH